MSTPSSDQQVSTLWKRPSSVETLNGLLEDTLAQALGIRVVAVGDDWIVAEMPVDDRTRQPFGVLHGGASVALAETLGSVAAYLTLADDTRVAVGLEINANHIRSASEGRVTGRAEPLHLGRSTQVWQIRIEDEHERLVCISRLTMAVIDRPG